LDIGNENLHIQQVLLDEDTALVDVHTGEPVDPDAVDWNTEEAPDATPEDGLRHAGSVTERPVFTPGVTSHLPGSFTPTPGHFAGKTPRSSNTSTPPADLANCRRAIW
jgi:hypothetical protein